MLNSMFGPDFLRSLGYLWPYRKRLGVAIACVILIACLWGGGLGLILPGSKILLSPEGLHGWVWNTINSDRLEANLAQQMVPAGTRIAGQDLSVVLNVASTKKDGRSRQAGIGASDWIVGLREDGADEVVRGDVLAKRLAMMERGEQVQLLVYRPLQRSLGTAEVKIGRLSWWSRNLGHVAEAIPDPGADLSARFPIFLGLLVVTLILTAARAILTFSQEYLVGSAIWRGMMDLRCDNYNVVLHLPTTFFSEKGISDATSRFIQDTGELARGQNTLLGKTMIEPAKAVASLAMAAVLSWQLTLVAALAGPPAFWMIHTFSRRMHKATKRALESWSGMLSALSETLIGIRVVKAYTMESSERKRFFRINRALVKQQNKMEAMDAATGPGVETLGVLFGMAAAGGAGYLVFYGSEAFGGKMDPEKFLAWMVALFALFDPVRKLAKVSMRFQASDAAARRIFDLQDTPQEKRIHKAPSLSVHRKSLEFRNVCFRYPSAAENAIHDACLRITAGQTVAIVGPNGSGKTTLLSLVPRLLDPTDGAVLIDGQDIAQCSVRSLRRQIGLVTQDTVLFHATIAENIAYGLRRPRREAVLEAGRKAFVDEFVREMPQGYDTMVGEHGATLSGGQKQRISIARAILRNPAILIFDEAMSQVDADSEHRISQAMAEFVKGRTTLLIAHRFATIMAADVIAVMNAGRIVDTGTHKELLDRCEIYEHLYRTQFADSGG